MITEQLFFTSALRIREGRNTAYEDRLLADVGLTRADLIKQKRWFHRKAK
jgi:hypothetical protein